ncbi:hypothetical protein WMY93_026477 [Mugilogobius chulae]|uniref:Ig-like domain-containing protein n=1 Tax=Mugilogobius chulae TaxID=88201 RepID=A0AAW0N7U4_9GOBI
MNQSGNYSCQAFNNKTLRSTTSQPASISVLILNRKESGSYVCEISNPINTERLFTPDCKLKRSNLRSNRSSGEQIINMTCFSDSVPTADYTWIKNGNNLANTSEYIKTINGTADEGEYICRASNDITNKTSEASHYSSPSNSGCTTGCIIGIVIGCVVLALVVCGGLFFFLKKNILPYKGKRPKNSFLSPEVNYADVMFVKKGGGVVHLAPQNQTEYAEVQKNNNQPASRLPNYNEHMQRGRRPAPQPPQQAPSTLRYDGNE